MVEEGTRIGHPAVRRSPSSGAGFVINPCGILVTSLHVLGDASLITVRLAGGEVFNKVKVRAYDLARDLAVLESDRAGLVSLPIDESRVPRPGERVVAIGHPMGLLNTVSDGIVCGVRRTRGGADLIQFTATVYHGSSGGPLLDEGGRVVGVVSIGAASAYAPGFGFAVSTSGLRRLIEVNHGLGLKEFAQRLAVDRRLLRATGCPDLARGLCFLPFTSPR